VLHKELDPDDDELTRTRKVRRGFVEEKYRVLITALYERKNVAVHRDHGQVRRRAHREHRRGSSHLRCPRFSAGSRQKGGLRVTMADPGHRIGEVILELGNISLSFGGVKALTDISFDVREHEIRAIIGPNGAGKSSMLNVINGVYRPQQGTITFHGQVQP
jgi:ABC-type molybdenum transport system ATPase subunit/photorepair protein PhrA